MSIESVYKEAVSMRPAERIELIDKLMLSLDLPNSDIDALWKKEAEARLKAYDSGQITSKPAEVVFNKYAR